MIRIVFLVFELGLAVTLAVVPFAVAAELGLLGILCGLLLAHSAIFVATR